MRFAFVIVCVLVAACSEPSAPAAGRLPVEDSCSGRADGWICDEQGEALRCEANRTAEREACGDQEQMCVVGLGCRLCLAGSTTCQDETFMRCASDGSHFETVEMCEGDRQCSKAGCVDLCARAAELRSYIGCEYWPVTTANAELNPAFQPALAVGNPNFQAAQVRLERGEESWSVEVPPGGVEVLPLPFVSELKTPFEPSFTDDGSPVPVVTWDQPRSVLSRGGAYHLVSTVPVTVHQFNPLEFESDRCQGEEGGECFSFTNDASLLLPTTAMTGEYMVVTRPTFANFGDVPRQKPGFVAIVGTQPEPTEVEVRVTAFVSPSIEGSADPLPALVPGDSVRVTLEAGDVLQLASDAVAEPCPGPTSEDTRARPDGREVQFVYCDPGKEYDLTGTEIEASAPVEVIAGHDCTFVPFDRWACDHLEEAMFPLQAWGDEVVVTRPRRTAAETYLVKVVSAVDGNRLRTDPPLDREIVLDRGESFEWATQEHMVVRGDGPLSVAQFLQGQGGAQVPGDPSMSLAIPRGQFKREYALLTPDTFPEAYVNVVSSAGVAVRLDDREVTNFTPIGDSGLSVARVRLRTPGLHVVEADGPAGVVLYGFADFTSYMVPGGLDFRALSEAPF